MTMTADEFKGLKPEAREEVLAGLRLEKEFVSLSPQDRTQINTLLSAQKDQKMTEAEALSRGGAQGLAFGFADELIAGLSAAGQALVGSSDFEPSFEKALKAHRERDKLAQAKFPKLFGGSELGGAAAISLVPGLGVLGKGVQATSALRKLSSTASFGKKIVAGKAAREGTAAVAKLGKGVGKGATGAAKASAGGAATSVGKAEDKTIEGAKEGAIIGGLTGAGASVLGPAVRGAGRLIGKNIGRITKGVAIGSVGFVKTALGEQALKAMAKGAVEKAPRLSKAIDGFAKLGKGGVNVSGKFINVLAEAFEKQGGAGLVETHRRLLKDPGYVEFLDKVEKQQSGLRPPKRGKK